jgi:hypothetical protein
MLAYSMKFLIMDERNPHKTQQQEPVARCPGEPQTKMRQGARQSTDRLIN